MKSEKLKESERKFLSNYQTNTMLDKSMIVITNELYDEINTRLKNLDLQLFQHISQDNFHNDEYNFFVCKPQDSEKIIDGLDNKTNAYDIYEDSEKIISFCENTEPYQKHQLFFKLLTSDFYTKKLPAIELSQKLDNSLSEKITSAQMKM